MPAFDSPLRSLMPSVLDRLLDQQSMGTPGSGIPLNSIVEAVRRDVEALLNTRRNSDPELERFPELSASMYTFGMPELVSRPALSGPEREAIGRLIADAIMRSEPRLRNVRTTLLSGKNVLERQLKFRIEGTLRVDPSPGVEFETVLELSSGQAAVVARQT